MDRLEKIRVVRKVRSAPDEPAASLAFRRVTQPIQRHAIECSQRNANGGITCRWIRHSVVHVADLLRFGRSLRLVETIEIQNVMPADAAFEPRHDDGNVDVGRERGDENVIELTIVRTIDVLDLAITIPDVPE